MRCRWSAMAFITMGLWVLFGGLGFAAEEATPKKDSPNLLSGELREIGMQLLSVERVRNELQLTGEQKAEIRGITETLENDIQRRLDRLMSLPAEKRNAEARTIQEAERKKTEEFQKKFEAVLTPPQLERLGQLALQAGGVPAAMMRPTTQRLLKMTDAQKQKLQAARADYQTKFRNLIAPGSNLAGRQVTDLQAKMRGLIKEHEAVVEGVLTQEQRAELERLMGPKFDVDWRELAPRFPMRRPPSGKVESRPASSGNK